MPLSSNISRYLDSIAEFAISPFFVGAWCCLIGLYAGKHLLHLYWQSRLIGKSLIRMKKRFKKLPSTHELPAEFAIIHQEFVTFPKTKQAWREYQQSLLKVPVNPQSSQAETISTTGSRHDTHSIHSTKDAELFFNSKTVIAPHLDRKVYSNLANHLSGLGILGTFCGLACGIYLARSGLAGGNMQEIQASLAQLLSGASLAFATSIAGISFSLIFSRLQQGQFKNLEDLIGGLNDTLGQLIPCVSQERLASQQVQQNIRQQYELEKIAKQLQVIHEDRAKTNADVLKQIAKEFNETMVASAGKEIHYIASAFQKIHLGLKETKESLKDTGQLLFDSVEASTQMFKKNLHTMSHQFHSNFTVTNDEIQKTFKGAAKEIQSALEKGSVDMNHAITGPSRELGHTIKSLQTQMQQTGQAYAKECQSNRESTQRIIDAQAKLSEVISPLVQASHAISKSCSEAQGSLNQSSHAALKIANSVTQMESISGDLKNSWDSYCKRFKGVDQNLSQVFQQTNQSLLSYSEKVKAFTSDLDRQMSKGSTTLAGAVGDLNQAIVKLPEMIRAVQKSALRSGEPSQVTYPDSRIS